MFLLIRAWEIVKKHKKIPAETGIFQISGFQDFRLLPLRVIARNEAIQEVRISDFKISDFKISDFKISDFKISDFKISDFKISDFKISDFKI